MSFDLYLQLSPDVPSDIRERIAALLDADPDDEEFPYANEATGVDALFALDDDLLPVTVNCKRLVHPRSAGCGGWP